MATYKESIGTAVTNVAGDPPAPAIGQVWYNSSTGNFRLRKESTGGAWATGNNMNVTRDDSPTSGAGTQTAGLVFGGETSPGNDTETESYNGTNWTAVNAMNTARNHGGGVGATNTAALAFGGVNPGSASLNATENWNGTNWN